MAEKTISKNIYQRMLEVQKKVTSVNKESVVKMSENDRGYKAVTHDDVAAALHIPLAEAGIFMLPDVESFSVSEFEKTNKWGNVTTWYRTDIKIVVKWINVDNPQEYIESRGAAFALDSSDKSFAKAYSLALKIVLLKVHLLESRDGEEDRVFEQATENGVETKKQPVQKQKETKQKESTPLSPSNFIMPFGSVKGKKLGELDFETLTKVQNYLQGELSKDPMPENSKNIAFILSQVDAVLINQKPQKIEKQEEFIPCDIPGLPGKKGARLLDLTESEMKQALRNIDSALKQTPPPEDFAQLFVLHKNIKQFLTSVGSSL